MSALIPGLTSGINGGKNKYVAIFGFCDILTYPAYFKYVVQNVQTCSIRVQFGKPSGFGHVALFE